MATGLNAIVGVQNGRTREPIATIVDYAATGRTYVLSEGGRLAHPDTVVISEGTKDGIRNSYAVASSQKQADDFVHRIRSEGKPVTVTRERVPLLFASAPVVLWNFGRTDTFRAVARLVLNLLASHYPEVARQPWLLPLKNFIKSGGDSTPWVSYDYEAPAEPALPEDTFPFQHRFVLGFDARTGSVHARVSLLGVLEMSVRLGVTSIKASETLVYDMDVLAESSPSDIKGQRILGASLGASGVPTADPSPFVPPRLTVLLAKRLNRAWERVAPALVAAINGARSAEPFERHDKIVEALDGQQQRLLNLASFVANDARQLLSEQFGKAGEAIGDVFGLVAQPDGASRTGVSELTHAHTEMLRYVMADHILGILNEREIDADELRLLLEGGPGHAVVLRYMTDQVQGMPLGFREPRPTPRVRRPRVH